MSKTYEKFLGPDGMVRIGHSLRVREPEAAKPEQPKPKVKLRQLRQAEDNAEQPKADQTFATRLRAILDLPEARSRRRQALAIVAETAASPKEAAAILAALPDDRAAGFAHGGTLFPGSTVQHDAEAQRILSIVKSPEAEGREKQALEMALGTSLPIDQVLALLRGVVKAQTTTIPTIAERAAAETEIGEDFEVAKPAKRGDAAWAKAIAASAGGTAPASTPIPPAPRPYENTSARIKA